MLGFIKKLFGAQPVETPAPYKVETPAAPVAEVKKVAKKPAVKKATTRKTRAPKPN